MQKSSCSRLHSQRSIFGGMKNVKHAKRCTKQRRQFYLGDAPHHLDPFTGILLTVRLRGLQIRHLGKALHYVFHNEDDGEGEVTSFGALCTALQQRSELVIS